MIEDARPLQPEFTPSEVKHRDAETSHLSHALRPITNGGRGETSLLFGPSGVGKTCIAKFTVERLRQNALDINHQYVNCWEDYNRFKTLYRLLEGVGEAFDIHRQSTPRDVLLDRLRDYAGPHYVVVLDEVDQLEDKSLLYDLYRLQNLTMVLIANSEEGLFAHLDDRVNSRLSNSERIRFGHYSDEALVEILADRVRWGIRTDAIETTELEFIADASAGDARKAIGILRTAARSAQQNGDDHISIDVVREAIPEAKTEIRQTDLDRLTPEQRTVYQIIQETDVVTPGELYTEYQSRVDDPKTKRTIRNYLEKMQHYNLIDADGVTKGRTYKTVK